MCALLTAGACGGGGKSDPTQKKIGPQGGSVALADGTKVEIPAAALSSTTAITIAGASSVSAPASATVVGPAYLFGPEGTTFAAPVTVTLAFMATRLPAGKTAADVVIFTAPVGSSSYAELPTTVADASHVQVTATHFSIFVPAVVTSPSDGGTNDNGGSGGSGGTNSTNDAGPAPDAATPTPDAGPDGGSGPEVVVLVPRGKTGNTPGNTQGTLAIDNAYLYWISVEGGGTTAMRISKQGGGDPTVAYQPPNRPGGPNNGGPGALLATLAVDDTSLYVAIGNDIYTSEILKVAKDGSTHTEPSLLKVAGLGAEAATIAVDSQNVYFASNPGGVASVSKNGGAKVMVVNPFLPDGSCCSAGPVDPILGTAIGFPNMTANTLVLDGTNLYYSVVGRMLKAPLGGGAPVVLVPKLDSAAGGLGYIGGPGYPAVSGGYVYWTNYGYVFKVPAAGGTPEELVSGPSTGDFGNTATDGKSVYYLKGGSLWKVPVTGGTPVLLVPAEAGYDLNFGPMLVDDTSVYVTAYSWHGFVKVAK